MMIKLTEFRIRNFRCIDDSGWIKVDDITSLVGINESGKTAILHALCTLNPGSNVLNINYIRDFPRIRLTSDYNEDCIVAEGRFLITNEYLKKMNLIDDFNLNLDDDIILTLTRKYNKTLYYRFNVDLEKKYIKTLIEALKQARGNINRKKIDESPQERELESINEQPPPKEKDEMQEVAMEFFTKKVQELIINVIDNFIEKIKKNYNEDSIFATPTKRNEFVKFLEEFNRILGQYFNIASEELNVLLDLLESIIIEMNDKSGQTRLYETIESDIPVFIYFEDYSILEGTIIISDLVKAIIENLEIKQYEIQKTLFKHVNLDPIQIYELSPQYLTPEQEKELQQRLDNKNISAKQIKEEYFEKVSEKKQEELKQRKILLDSASQLMTETLNKYFQERDYRVEYTTDGQFLQILVSDNIKPSKINLEERSKGFRWYYSFFLVFLVESEGMHKNAILLLDEPGIHLHLQAQFNLINFFQKLRETNQIIYTTHSPFLIDENHLEQVRSVFEDDKGITRITENNLIPDKRAIFPLQAALSYSTSQVIYQGLKQLLLEGDIDYNYIKAINHILIELNKKALEKDIVIVPCKSASKIEMYARLFIDLENVPVVLLDSDEAGNEAYEVLTESLFSEHKKNVLQIGEFINNKKDSEIEDLIGKDILVKVINRNNLARPLISASEIENGPFIDSLISYCKKKNIKLVTNWKYELSLKFKNEIFEIDSNKIPNEIPQDIINRIEKLISKINQYAEKKHRD